MINLPNVKIIDRFGVLQINIDGNDVHGLVNAKVEFREPGMPSI